MPAQICYVSGQLWSCFVLVSSRLLLSHYLSLYMTLCFPLTLNMLSFTPWRFITCYVIHVRGFCPLDSFAVLKWWCLKIQKVSVAVRHRKNETLFDTVLILWLPQRAWPQRQRARWFEWPALCVQLFAETLYCRSVIRPWEQAISCDNKSFAFVIKTSGFLDILI